MCMTELLWNGMVSYNTHRNEKYAKIVDQLLELYELLCDYNTVYWRRFDGSKMRSVFIMVLSSSPLFSRNFVCNTWCTFHVDICFCHVHVLLIVWTGKLHKKTLFSKTYYTIIKHLRIKFYHGNEFDSNRRVVFSDKKRRSYHRVKIHPNKSKYE